MHSHPRPLPNMLLIRVEGGGKPLEERAIILFYGHLCSEITTDNNDTMCISYTHYPHLGSYRRRSVLKHFASGIRIPTHRTLATSCALPTSSAPRCHGHPPRGGCGSEEDEECAQATPHRSHRVPEACTFTQEATWPHRGEPHTLCMSTHRGEPPHPTCPHTGVSPHTVHVHTQG